MTLGAMTSTQTEAEPPQWGIQDFAALHEITPRTLRFYEDKGLINPARQSGGRIYSPEDKVRVEEILRAKRLGFTLEDIKVVMDVTDGHVTDRDELLLRRENFQKVIRSLRRRRKDIDILSLQMTDLCTGIDKFVEDTAGHSAVFKYANAYDAALREHMDDDFASEITPQFENIKIKG